MGDDAVVRELGTQCLQRGLNRPHLIDTGRFERKMVQSGCFRGEPAIALLPQRQPEGPAGAEEGVPVLAVAVDGQRFETNALR